MADNTEQTVYTQNIEVLKAILELLEERLPAPEETASTEE